MPAIDSLRKAVVPAAFAVGLFVGCDTFTEPGDEKGPVIRTDSLEYHLIPRWGGLRVDIPYTFDNRTGRRVFLVNCNDLFSILLQREQDGEWRVSNRFTLQR